MGDRQGTQFFTPAEAAALVGVPVHSIRRWCEYHKPHLSETANPEPHQARRLTRRDIEVLRTVKDLRDQGLTVPVINERLRDMVFGDIDSTDSSPNTSLTAPASPGTAITPLMVVDAMQSALAPVEARLQALEAQRPTWRDTIIIGLACLFLGVMIGLAVWMFQ